MFKRVGLTLIEIMVCLVLLSFVLLSLDATEFTAMKRMQQVYFYHLAAEQIYSFAERLRTLKNEDYTHQVALWSEQTKKLLPQGKVDLTEQPEVLLINLSWGEDATKCTEASKKTNCLSLKTIKPLR